MENNKVYIVVYRMITEDIECDETSVAGVFSTKEKALAYAKDKMEEKYAKDVADMYDNDKDNLTMFHTAKGTEYHSNIDFYEVEMRVYKETIDNPHRKFGI